MSSVRVASLTGEIWMPAAGPLSEAVRVASGQTRLKAYTPTSVVVCRCFQSPVPNP
ncbi:hypothetical protein [Nostoc sp. DSM 114161]|uniref:hypothetical protein n=1 Tax=Nostoc sp. DSM 114161 TaxID=3440143 RepID=UPI0040455C57